MTQQELKLKLDAALDKVNARKTTIEKICKKLGIDSNALFNAYYEKAKIVKKGEYFKRSYGLEVASQFVQEKPLKNPDGSWNFENGDFNSKIDQLGDNLSKLYEVEKTAQGWQEKYDTQKNKENAPKIAVIWEFLTNWETRMRDLITDNANEIVKEMNKFHTIAHNYLAKMGYDISKHYNQTYKVDFINQFNRYFFDEYEVKPRYRWSDVDEQDWLEESPNVISMARDLSVIRFKQEDNYSYDQVFGHSAHNGKFVLVKFDSEKLDKILAQDKLAKYYDLCNRISDIVGEITDASNLSIGHQHGEINGIVVGTKGKAKVETIGAGGYNIQCFHFRVLVHKLR